MLNSLGFTPNFLTILHSVLFDLDNEIRYGFFMVKELFIWLIKKKLQNLFTLLFKFQLIQELVTNDGASRPTVYKSVLYLDLLPDEDFNTAFSKLITLSHNSSQSND